jgi:hypothetical protein
MDQLATIEPGGPDRLGSVLTSLRTRGRGALVVAVMGTMSPTELDALGGLTAHGSVTVVATRPPLDVLPGDRIAPPATARQVAAPAQPLVLVDTYAVPFPIAWNETMTRWQLSALATSPRSPSPR